MMRALYIIPADLLTADTPRDKRPVGQANWGLTPIPGDPTKALLDVKWEDDPNAQPAFESLPGVLPLGFPWEPLPAEAVALLASIQHFAAAYAEASANLADPTAAKAAGIAAAMARVDPLAISVATITDSEVADGDSVARAILKIGRRFW